MRPITKTASHLRSGFLGADLFIRPQVDVGIDPYVMGLLL